MCYTPEGIAGDCRSIYQCPSVLSQTQGRITRRIADYLRSLQCENGSGQYPHVCCAILNDFEQWQSPLLQPQLTQNVNPGRTNAGNRNNGAHLPGQGSCGLTSLAHRIYGGDETQLDDYPWMALLEYQGRKCHFNRCICSFCAISATSEPTYRLRLAKIGFISSDNLISLCSFAIN